MISSLSQSHLGQFNSGTQLMPQRNFTKMVHLDKNTHKLNLTAQPLMRMEFVTLVVPMVEYMCGTRNKILVLY